jgi:hypothetical protein
LAAPSSAPNQKAVSAGRIATGCDDDKHVPTESKPIL